MSSTIAAKGRAISWLLRWRAFRHHENKLREMFVGQATGGGFDRSSGNFALPVRFEEAGVFVVTGRGMSKMQARTFDPAAWIEQAEAYGYKIFLWDAYCDVSLGVLTLNPVGRELPSDYVDLWWTLRPNSKQAEINDRTLALYLWDSDRVGPEEMRPGYASSYTRNDVSRQSERPRTSLGKAARCGSSDGK
jgi:hypothetical protein